MPESVVLLNYGKVCTYHSIPNRTYPKWYRISLICFKGTQGLRSQAVNMKVLVFQGVPVPQDGYYSGGHNSPLLKQPGAPDKKQVTSSDHVDHLFNSKNTWFE